MNGTGTVDPVDVGVVGQIVEVLSGEGDIDDAGQGSKVVVEGETSGQDGLPSIVVPVLDVDYGHIDGTGARLQGGRRARGRAVLPSRVQLLCTELLLLFLFLHRCFNLAPGSCWTPAQQLKKQWSVLRRE